jgi:hypothetical protein
MEGNELVLDARVVSHDGRAEHFAHGEASLGSDERNAMMVAEEVGKRVADRLLVEGAGAVIEAARRMN